MDEQKRIVAMNLSRLIAESGKTQAQVADDLGISRPSMNMWVNGVTMPRAGKVQMLADYFGVGKSMIVEPYDSTGAMESMIRRIAEYTCRLNTDGLKKLAERADELSQLEKYRKEEENVG